MIHLNIKPGQAYATLRGPVECVVVRRLGVCPATLGLTVLAWHVGPGGSRGLEMLYEAFIDHLEAERRAGNLVRVEMHGGVNADRGHGESDKAMILETQGHTQGRPVGP